MKTCSIEGCNNKRRSRGWCGKHYKRFRLHGDPLKMTYGVIDEIGNIYSKLKVVERSGMSKNGCVTWLCICECGNTIIIAGTNLRSHSCTSCGCARFLPPGVSALHSIIRIYKYNAKTRGLVWTLTKEQAIKLFDANCYYCGAAPSNVGTGSEGNSTYIYSGIDRIDNSIGYLPDNVVSCCKMCNVAKNTYDVDEFISWVHRIASRHKI